MFPPPQTALSHIVRHLQGAGFFVSPGLHTPVCPTFCISPWSARSRAPRGFLFGLPDWLPHFLRRTRVWGRSVEYQQYILSVIKWHGVGGPVTPFKPHARSLAGASPHCAGLGVCDPPGGVNPDVHRPQHHRYVPFLAAPRPRGPCRAVATRASIRPPHPRCIYEHRRLCVVLCFALLWLPRGRPRRAVHLHLRKMWLVVGTVARFCPLGYHRALTKPMPSGR